MFLLWITEESSWNARLCVGDYKNYCIHNLLVKFSRIISEHFFHLFVFRVNCLCCVWAVNSCLLAPSLLKQNHCSIVGNSGTDMDPLLAEVIRHVVHSPFPYMWCDTDIFFPGMCAEMGITVCLLTCEDITLI